REDVAELAGAEVGAEGTRGGNGKPIAERESQHRADGTQRGGFEQHEARDAPALQAEHAEERMLAAATRRFERLRRKDQEAAGEERHHREHVQVHPVGARRIGARLLEAFHRRCVRARRQQRLDLRHHRCPIGLRREAHVEAVQLTEAPEAPLRRRDIDERGQAALVDIATAQWRFGRLGELNRLDVRLAPKADRAAVVSQIQALLPPGAHATAVEGLEQASAYPSRAYRVNLDVLAMVALFTGGFLVFSAQALEVARRRGEHALLRVLGLRRGELARLVLAEAAALGAAGGVLGVALGYGFAVAAARTVGADLGGGAFRGLFPQPTAELIPALAYLLAGV